ALSLRAPGVVHFFFLLLRPPRSSRLFPYTTLFRSELAAVEMRLADQAERRAAALARAEPQRRRGVFDRLLVPAGPQPQHAAQKRSEEHTSELQSLRHLVCRLLLEKKKK